MSFLILTKGVGGPPPVHQWNWNPGYYGLTLSPFQGNPSTTFSGTYKPEIDLCIGQTNVVGYSLILTWASLEYQTLGNWQFGGSFFFDQIYNYCSTNGLKLIIQFNPSQFDNGTPNAPGTGSNNPMIPGYICQDASTYGAGQYGSSGVTPTGASGFYVQQTGGFCANLSNANVMARIQAFATQFASKYDGLLEGIIICAVDSMYPYAGIMTGTTYNTAVTNLYTIFKNSFSKTNVAIQMGWGDAVTGWTPTNVQQWVQTLVQAGVLVSSWDCAGASSWSGGSPFSPDGLSDGVNAWLGNTASWNGSTWTPPAPALQTYSRAMMQVQGGDMLGSGGFIYPNVYTAADMISAMNSRYNCSHPQFAIWQSTAQMTAYGFTPQTSALWSNILPAMAAQGVTNVGYPSVYPA